MGFCAHFGHLLNDGLVGVPDIALVDHERVHYPFFYHQIELLVLKFLHVRHVADHVVQKWVLFFHVFNHSLRIVHADQLFKPVLVHFQRKI